MGERRTVKIKKMHAIVVLTRGYDEKKHYNSLLKRNKDLEKYYNKDISYIIFHEGNIPKDHQKYIQYNTIIPLKFIDVSASFRNDEIQFYGPTNGFHMGYRNMCNFWFCDFWKYLPNYNKIIRIDEDCFYYSDYNRIFNMLDDKVCVYGKWDRDEDFVTVGLKDYTKNFMINNNKKALEHDVGGPYTNVLGLNLYEMRKNNLLLEYIQYIKKSDNIYIYRWGDLPLWGEALLYCFPKNSYSESNQISYYHLSHRQGVNI